MPPSIKTPRDLGLYLSFNHVHGDRGTKGDSAIVLKEAAEKMIERGLTLEETFDILGDVVWGLFCMQ